MTQEALVEQKKEELELLIVGFVKAYPKYDLDETIDAIGSMTSKVRILLTDVYREGFEAGKEVEREDWENRDEYQTGYDEGYRDAEETSSHP